ncbi:MAG: hypothetical protein LCI00_00150 [Chloroflexi bacterium]|nr:hypothetical protein [Chloroflexota bacterium]MCC6894348.1 hypothetical protein [Anaerolineae bacterium]
MSVKKLIFITLLFVSALPVFAQDPDPDTIVTVGDMSYGGVQQDSITEGAFYDWWRVQAVAGDMLVIDMGGADGLAPLLGLLDPGQNLVARSQDGEPDQSVTLEYTVPADGQYTIVATRVGNQEGTTTGRYALRLRLANPAGKTHDDQYVDATFACETFEATTAVTLRLGEDARPDLRYRITVYGQDGFIPVIRLNLEVPGQDPFELCGTSADATLSDTYTLPGAEAQTITQDDLNTVSQLVFSGNEKTGFVDLTIASKDGAAGHYFAIIDGFSIEAPEDTDQVDIRMGPLAKLTPLAFYMVGEQNSRLDPYLAWISQSMECDDAGRSACQDVPSIVGAGATLHDSGGATFTADRSDAGLILAPGTTDIMSIDLSSRSNDTFGAYVLFLMGELPPIS